MRPRLPKLKGLAMVEEPISDDREQTFLEHLVELRSRLLKSSLAVLAVLLVLLPFSRRLYELLAAPLTSVLPEGSSMIAIDVASPFLTPFKLSLLLALIIAIPVVLYQIWAFVAPALYRHEKKLAKPLLYSSVFLFYAGCAFAYFVVFPLVFGFFTSVAPDGVAVMTDISKYLDFVMTLFLAFGITFEVPIATIILVATGITTTKKLAKMRAYVLVGAFALGMMLTPPDVISQTLLAVPMWLLFEIGLFLSKILITNDDDEDETENEDGDGAENEDGDGPNKDEEKKPPQATN
jgi:sec-independent protein translocase protein TatC